MVGGGAGCSGQDAVRPPSVTALWIRRTRREESVSSSLTGRNSNAELRKKANSSPAPESPPGPTQRLLLAAALFLFVSCVVFFEFIASFSPLGRQISAGEGCQVGTLHPLGGLAAWPRPSSAEVASSARSECKRVRTHGKPCSRFGAGPAPGRPDSVSGGNSSLR